MFSRNIQHLKSITNLIIFVSKNIWKFGKEYAVLPGLWIHRRAIVHNCPEENVIVWNNKSQKESNKCKSGNDDLRYYDI